MYNVTKLLTSPTKENVFGQSALHFTTRIGDFQLVNLVLQKGASSVNAMDAFENTPLSISCIDVPRKVIVKLLLNYGANVNFERKLHMNFFLECVLNCYTEEQLEIIKLLIEKGVTINITDEVSNRNCMHYVAINGNVSLAKLLLINGAILDIRDNFNYTPIEIASNHNNYELLNLFKYYLAK